MWEGCRAHKEAQRQRAQGSLPTESRRITYRQDPVRNMQTGSFFVNSPVAKITRKSSLKKEPAQQPKEGRTLNLYPALLRARARRGQVFRKDITKPQKTDPHIQTSQRITELLNRSHAEERQKRISVALELTQEAVRLARSLPKAEENSRVSFIERREKELTREFRQKERRLMRQFGHLSVHSLSSS